LYYPAHGVSASRRRRRLPCRKPALRVCPVDEHLTVLSGTFRIGMGERGAEADTTALGVGAYAFLPAKMVHYAWADDNTVVQAHGIGPFAINYVNPADDPASAKRK
jgi:hypothetical protein